MIRVDQNVREFDELLKVRAIIAALADVDDRGNAFVREYPTNEIAQPEELWIPALCMWVRCNGRLITGGGSRIRPGFWAAWRIRRAIKRWRLAHRSKVQ